MTAARTCSQRRTGCSRPKGSKARTCAPSPARLGTRRARSISITRARKKFTPTCLTQFVATLTRRDVRPARDAARPRELVRGPRAGVLRLLRDAARRVEPRVLPVSRHRSARVDARTQRTAQRRTLATLAGCTIRWSRWAAAARRRWRPDVAFGHGVGLLLLVHTGRIRMFRQDGRELVPRVRGTSVEK